MESPFEAGRTTCAAATVAGLCALTLVACGGDPQEFPILDRPAVDATRIRSATPIIAQAAADYGSAREVATPSGPGYVISLPAGALCLAVPSTDGRFDESCATTAEARRRGLVMVRRHARDGGGDIIAVLPRGAARPFVRRADGGTTRLEIRDGVAVASIRQRATMTIEIDGRRTAIEVPFEDAPHDDGSRSS